jgi:hypothetical protein
MEMITNNQRIGKKTKYKKRMKRLRANKKSEAIKSQVRFNYFASYR